MATRCCDLITASWTTRTSEAHPSLRFMTPKQIEDELPEESEESDQEDQDQEDQDMDMDD